MEAPLLLDPVKPVERQRGSTLFPHADRALLVRIKQWTPDQVQHDFLERMGLGRYGDVFRANGIGGAQLVKLSRDDLDEMIPCLGHRLALDEQIRDLRVAAVVAKKMEVLSEFEDYHNGCTRMWQALGNATRGIMGTGIHRRIILTRGSLKLITRRFEWLKAKTTVDNVDITDVIDVSYTSHGRTSVFSGCAPLGTVTIRTNDPTSPVVELTQVAETAKEIERDVMDAKEADEDDMNT